MTAVIEPAITINMPEVADPTELSRQVSAALLQEFDRRDARPAVVKREPLTYEYHTQRSFFQDLALANRGDPDATSRLYRHQHEYEVEKRVAPNTTTGTGGEFAPPMWAIDKFQTQARAGRVLGDLVTNLALPPGVSSIHVPKMTTGADAAIQTAQGVSATDVDEVTADAGANGNVVTITGNADVSQQLFDLVPPPGYDGIVYTDLNRAYNQTLEKQMLAGTGANGQLTGITKVASIVTVDGSGVSTTQNTMVTNLWTMIGQAAASVGTLRQLPPEVIVMSPRRYYAIASAEDSQNRPLASPGQGPHPNDMPIAGNSLPVGPIIGIPCYLSGGIIGATAATADYIIVARVADMLLYESDIKFAVAPNPLAGALQIRLQLRRYVAFLNFKAASIAVVTAIPAPTNF